jgi:hypothetical protein
VSLFLPPLLFISQGSLGDSPWGCAATWGAANVVTTRGKVEYSPRWCIFHEKELQDPEGIFRQAPDTVFLVHHDKPTHGMAAREAARWGRPGRPIPG